MSQVITHHVQRYFDSLTSRYFPSFQIVLINALTVLAKGKAKE